ncbi:bifunctional DNA-formamidopyrimidine glycosylase/DNA-(apurinic or apyrimidinic site) lyase [Govanella unica]|uniref:Formamidopyrimidine-DNA glycosylase n=1 Tax=Govanella unica TaxID=2975056 RepID=A0A9X3TZJ5_9PROT|nr:bifunctional DNA-formamidopyrimidine glycosylase/DNA-(apurinic or apyrimidinic site) lyase [Govania unica]MDA5194635.1 bifunctional DNA-formamidopyrimidine glycosylase/DNA-(apurinic or apyrimidinic site) lyase [Govania unica]
MPELPEVETVARGIAPALVGRRIARVLQRRADLRIPFPAGFPERLTGRRIDAVRRRAKYLLWDLDDGQTVLVHLGMSGSFHVLTGGAALPDEFGPHAHVVIETEGGDRLIYNDPRRFGLMTVYDPGAALLSPWLKNLGPEPLGNEFSAEGLSVALDGRRSSIKAALLDQAVVAGLGNIYVAEALFRARISPRRAAYTVAGARAERLAPAIRDVLREAIESGGSSLKDFVHSDGTLGYFQHRFHVYDRTGQPCVTPGCGATVQRIVQSGRSTFFCGQCQR